MVDPGRVKPCASAAASDPALRGSPVIWPSVRQA
jgi:hypothetical protein